jgi:hypothetical protein
MDGSSGSGPGSRCSWLVVDLSRRPVSVDEGGRHVDAVDRKDGDEEWHKVESDLEAVSQEKTNGEGYRYGKE